MTEQTTPEILSEEALKEIEKRINAFPLSPFQARALCQTVRALKAELADLQGRLAEEVAKGVNENVEKAERPISPRTWPKPWWG